MTYPRITWIALALCVACARRDDRGAPAAGDTAKGGFPVAQAGDAPRDTTADGSPDSCIGHADTIEVSGPTIIASSGETFWHRDAAPVVASRDSAARDSVDGDESDGEGGDNSFLLAALPACGGLHSAGIAMYLNGDTTRMILRRGQLSSMSFGEEGFVFMDTTGVRHREEGALRKHRILELSDSLFGTHLYRGLEP